MTDSRPLAVVTGASAGIGAAYARRLSALGFDLMLVARRRERLEALAAEVAGHGGSHAEVLPADLASDAGIASVEGRIARADNLEFLLNNAGFGTRGMFHEASVESQDAMHRLHILATVRLTHAALQVMTARRKGAIVNVSSVAAFVCRPNSTSYHATKAWINHFTEGIQLELKRSRSPVKVQALCPGFTLTEFHDVAGIDRQQIPAGWWMRVDEVVDESLRSLDRNQLYAVPGWRYKALVALLRVVPHRLANAGAALLAGG